MSILATRFFNASDIPMANDLQLNLGALRSAMQLTLHTHHASRIWHGRAQAEGRAGIAWFIMEAYPVTPMMPARPSAGARRCQLR